MARASKLKVYRTPAGFYDAYVAARSQKAALEAWGSERDLFARGIAELVTDPALSAAPLASPGVVVKLSRGTTAEQIAAMPAPKPRSAPPDVGKEAPVRKRASSSKSIANAVSAPKPKPKLKPKPKPSSAKLEAAENALEKAKATYDRKLKAVGEREAKIARERRELERRQQHELDQAEKAVDEQRRAYDGALREWKVRDVA